MKNIKQKALQARKEATLWQYAAWTLPFVALAIIVLEYFIGIETWYHLTILIITIVFFTISVFWWWWAVSKFAMLMQAMNETNENFISVKENLKSIRDDIKDVSNR